MKRNVLLVLISLLYCSNIFSQVLPASFDLRNFNNSSFVTSVKHQQGGTCWTHGALAAIEGNLMINGNWWAAGDTGEPNLAEYHLDWWNGFNDHHNDDIFPASGSGLTVHMGGDYRVTAAYLGRGEGAVRDIDGQSYNSAPAHFDTSYHIYYPMHIEWFEAGTNLENIDTIKKQIMMHGVMGTCMCVDASFMIGDTMHYQPGYDMTDPNHAIAIIGWDDSLQTQAPQPGAWLCKNSWGTGWGIDGYFWISYYDKHCGHHPEMGAITFREVDISDYDKVYYHDYHGWRNTDLNAQAVFNVFEATANQVVDALSFYSATNNVGYNLIVYDKFINGQLQDTLTSALGSFNYTGFHTVVLDTSFAVATGDTFYVYLKLSHGGYPYDRTSDVPVLLGGDTRTIVTSAASPGESYFYNGQSWIDLYTQDTTANYCVKALAKDNMMVGIDENDLKQTPAYGFKVFPNPSTSHTTVEFALDEKSWIHLELIDMFGRKLMLLIDEEMAAGTHRISEELAESLSPGIYFYLLRVNNQQAASKPVLLKH